MTYEEAKQVIFTEWKCVDRNDGIHCDRKCEDCDLVLPIDTIREAYNIALNAMDIVDGVDKIVTCKDCKHWNEEEHDCNIKAGHFTAPPDWFCADGERKE